MKYERPPSEPINTADDVVMANRWQEREASRNANLIAPPTSPQTRANVARMFHELLNSIDESVADPWRAQRPFGIRGKDARQSQAYREAAEQHLSELQEQYAENPPAVSDRLAAKIAASQDELQKVRAEAW